MPAPEKYADFTLGEPFYRQRRNGREGEMMLYQMLNCPHCKCDFDMIVVGEDGIKKKADLCLAHLRKPCPAYAAKGLVAPTRRKRSLSVNDTDNVPFVPDGRRSPGAAWDSEDEDQEDPLGYEPVVGVPIATNTDKQGDETGALAASHDEEPATPPCAVVPVQSPGVSSEETPLETAKEPQVVTIYALIFLPTGKQVYIGRTKDPKRRLSQHASPGSKCRLVRNAFRKYGRKSFTLEPILRCRAEDADVNESYWIMQSGTLHPGGYNLRHGSMAGEEADAYATALVPACMGVVPFGGIADETAACAEAWMDVADIVAQVDEKDNEAEQLCKDFLKQVHPDRSAEPRSYSANEVSAMLNAVRDACKG